MGLFDEITNYYSGGKQKGYEQYGDTLGRGMSEMRDNTNRAVSYLDPFRSAGLGQLGSIQQAISRMLNPEKFNKDMMSGYSMSPQAQHQMSMGNDAATNAALASGMAGSTSHLNEINEQSQAIANRDQQQYLDNAFRTYNQGLGTSQNLYGQGLGAAGQMGGFLSALNGVLGGMYDKQGETQLGASQAKTGGLTKLFSALF